MPMETMQAQEQKMSQEKLMEKLAELMKEGVSAEDIGEALSTMKSKNETPVEAVAEIAPKNESEGVPTKPTTPEVTLPPEETAEQRAENVTAKQAEIKAEYDRLEQMGTPKGRIERYHEEALADLNEMRKLLDGEGGMFKDEALWRNIRDNKDIEGYSVPVNKATWETDIQAPMMKGVGEAWGMGESPSKISEATADKWKQSAEEMHNMLKKMKADMEKAKATVNK